MVPPKDLLKINGELLVSMLRLAGESASCVEVEGEGCEARIDTRWVVQYPYDNFCGAQLGPRPPDAINNFTA